MPDDPSPSTFDPREVVAFREFRSMQVPALLSTSEHLSHLLTTSTTPYTPNDIKTVVHLHEHIVKHITRDDVQQTFLVGEAALHGLSGAQLAHMLQCCLHRNTVVRILPGLPWRAAGLRALVVMSFADKPDLAFPQSPTHSGWLRKPADVSRFNEIFDQLAAHALSEFDSRAYIQTRLGELSTALHRNPDDTRKAS
jgi:hypothetical protein